MPVIYARRGEWVTCEGGHKICRFRRDVRWFETFEGQAVGDWQQPEPAVGTQHCPCTKCGASWFQANLRSGTIYHFRDGWRGIGKFEGDPARVVESPLPLLDRIAAAWRMLTTGRTT